MMMFKCRATLAVLTVGVTMLTGGSVFSGEKDQTATVPATVSFAGAEEPIAINRVNPADATTKDPAAPANMRKAGMPLTIDYASPWRFKTQKVSLVDRTYLAERDLFAGKEVANHVQVTDQREKLDGWELQIRQAKPFTHTSGAELKGAKLHVGATSVKSAVEGTLVMPSKGAITLNGEFARLASAKAGDGYGTSSLSMADVKLTVPGQVKKLAGNYSSEVVYKLLAAPTGA